MCGRCVLVQLPHPTPTIFTFPSEAAVIAAPLLYVRSPGGAERPVSPGLTPPPSTSPRQPLSPGRSYCPVVRGLSPTTTSGGGLSVVTANRAVRSPSVNRLGSLFNSINRSVTSAFSSFVVVHQPVPGVIQDYDQPSTLQRQLSQPTYSVPPRRASANQEWTTHRGSLSTALPTPAGSSTPAGGQHPRTVADEEPDVRGVMPLQRAPAPRRPRCGLPIHSASDPAPPHTNEPSNHNFSRRGNVRH